MTATDRADTAHTGTARPAGRPAWLVLAGAELRLLVRNRTALLTATATPLAFSGFTLLVGDLGDHPGGVAAMQLIMLLGFTVFVAAALVLTNRRQQLYLKRLRSSPASTTAVVAGLTAPLILLLLVQAGLVFAVTAVVAGQPPARPALLLLAALVGCVTCVGLAFLTAAFTRTPEAAQYTTFPGFLALVGGLIWVNVTPPAEVAPWQLLVPGAGVTQLSRYGWEAPLPEGTGLLAAVAPALLASLAVAALAAYLGARYFRWEPRS